MGSYPLIPHHLVSLCDQIRCQSTRWLHVHPRRVDDMRSTGQTGLPKVTGHYIPHLRRTRTRYRCSLYAVAALLIQFSSLQDPSAGTLLLFSASPHGSPGSTYLPYSPRQNHSLNHDLDSVCRTPPGQLPYILAYWQLVTHRTQVGSYCGQMTFPRFSPCFQSRTRGSH